MYTVLVTKYYKCHSYLSVNDSSMQIHTGLQHLLILPQQANGLPLELPTLADKLKESGYATHMVGKWHLGCFKKEYTPTYRGFDSFFGKLFFFI